MARSKLVTTSRENAVGGFRPTTRHRPRGERCQATFLRADKTRRDSHYIRPLRFRQSVRFGTHQGSCLPRELRNGIVGRDFFALRAMTRVVCMNAHAARYKRMFRSNFHLEYWAQSLSKEEPIRSMVPAFR